MININYEGKILVVELPEGERKGYCILSKEQQENFIQGIRDQFKKIINENGGTFVVPPRTRLRIMDLDKENSNY